MVELEGLVVTLVTLRAMEVEATVIEVLVLVWFNVELDAMADSLRRSEAHCEYI